MNILVLLEGDEEELLFDLFKPHVHSLINLSYINVKGFGNIPVYFQSHITNDYYDAVLCVYDVDNKVNISDSPYNIVRNNLRKILNTESRVSDISFCTNPNILQFLLLGADTLENVSLTSTSKKANTPILNRYWPKLGNKKEYSAASWQLDIIRNDYEYGNSSIANMINNAKQLPLDYKRNLPGSNLNKLLLALSEGNLEFFNKAIKAINIERK